MLTRDESIRDAITVVLLEQSSSYSIIICAVRKQRMLGPPLVQHRNHFSFLYDVSPATLPLSVCIGQRIAHDGT